ncbi:MAG: tripartite tricarboxylate transporter TctB family protein [bacterium]
MRDSTVIFTGAIALIGVWGLFETRGWPVQAWLYPRVVLIPLIALAVAESLVALRGSESRERETHMDSALETTVDPSVAMRKTLGIAVWIVGFFLTILLVGFHVAVPFFVFAFLRSRNEGWFLSLALAGTALLAFHALFVRVLHLPLPQGILFRLIGR